jgi:hypothetical protein
MGRNRGNHMASALALDWNGDQDKPWPFAEWETYAVWVLGSGLTYGYSPDLLSCSVSCLGQNRIRFHTVAQTPDRLTEAAQIKVRQCPEIGVGEAIFVTNQQGDLSPSFRNIALLAHPG